MDWQDVHKMSLKIRVVLETTEELKKKTKGTTYFKATLKPTERAPDSQSWNRVSKKINKTAQTFKLFNLYDDFFHLSINI